MIKIVNLYTVQYDQNSLFCTVYSMIKIVYSVLYTVGVVKVDRKIIFHRVFCLYLQNKI